MLRMMQVRSSSIAQHSLLLRRAMPPALRTWQTQNRPLAKPLQTQQRDRCIRVPLSSKRSPWWLNSRNPGLIRLRVAASSNEIVRTDCSERPLPKPESERFKQAKTLQTL
jgi:hypothetical protein